MTYLAIHYLPFASKAYFDQMISFGFNPQINLKTYAPSLGQLYKSGLNRVWHNFDAPSDHFVLSPSFSDHCLVAIFFRQYVIKLTKNVVFRDYSIKYQTNFIASLDNKFCTYRPPITNVNQYSEYFINFLTKM